MGKMDRAVMRNPSDPGLKSFLVVLMYGLNHSTLTARSISTRKLNRFLRISVRSVVLFRTIIAFYSVSYRTGVAGAVKKKTVTIESKPE